MTVCASAAESPYHGDEFVDHRFPICIAVLVPPSEP
jgi:hypothetical protein